jgi:tetratricopeptide (TPR) repeat protein
MKRIFLYIFFLIIAHQVSFAEKSKIISKANNLYQEGKYAEAIENYKQVLDSGYEAAGLYYNMGNAFFKLGKYTHAILYYEKARRLASNDEDINHNLNLVRENFVVDKIEELPEFFLTTWFKNFVHTLSADLWAYLSVGAFVLFLILLSVFLFSHAIFVKKLTFALSVLLIITSVLTFIFALKQKNYMHNHAAGIIYTPTVPIKSSPDFSGTDLFILHEGTKVQIRDSVSGWYEIRIKSGNIGWIKAEDLKRI